MSANPHICTQSPLRSLNMCIEDSAQCTHCLSDSCFHRYKLKRCLIRLVSTIYVRTQAISCHYLDYEDRYFALPLNFIRGGLLHNLVICWDEIVASLNINIISIVRMLHCQTWLRRIAYVKGSYIKSIVREVLSELIQRENVNYIYYIWIHYTEASIKKEHKKQDRWYSTHLSPYDLDFSIPVFSRRFTRATPVTTPNFPRNTTLISPCLFHP